ncbi:MAG: hypothetical protein M3419_04920 [Actinomycetota bacterium]|nr:hypothetical protein [Actinomycetota bacterium]
MSAVTQALVPEGTALPQVCTPCMAKLDQRPWLTTVAVKVGAWHVGVRVNSEKTRSLVESRLAPLRASAEDATVSPNFSVEIDGNSAKGTRSLNLLYKDHEIVARRRDPAELLDDLAELVVEVDLILRDDAPMVSAAVVLTPAREAVVLPMRAHKDLLTRSSQLRRRGLELLRARLHEIDDATGSIVLHAPAGMAVDEGAGRTLRGTFPIRAWCVSSNDSVQHDIRPAQLVYAGFGTVANRGVLGGEVTLKAMAEVAARVPGIGLPAMASMRLTDTVIGIAV